jgi:DMSO/TMAO reductase YedYZ heme-binding membrane subunit
MTPKKLLDNTRFYILLEASLLSLLVLFGIRSITSSDALYLIRSQQIFGLLSLFYWYAALIISPLKSFISSDHYEVWKFNRRALGVSAAYFAILHATVAFFGQSGGFGGIGLLPTRFRWSLLLGAIALLVLTLMAATSFDRAIRKLTFKRWKWLHRVGYIAGILVIVHVWLIGTHSSNKLVEIFGLSGLIFLFGLESLRSSKLIQLRFNMTSSRRIAVAILMFVILTGSLLALPRLVQNYHAASGHIEHGGGHAH